MNKNKLIKTKNHPYDLWFCAQNHQLLQCHPYPQNHPIYGLHIIRILYHGYPFD